MAEYEFPPGAGTPASSVTGPDAFGASSVVGTSTNYARQDHDHGLPTAPTSTAVPPGFLLVNTAGGFTQTVINNAVSGGYSGIYLDPTVTYNVASKLVIGGGSNLPFVLKSYMYGGSGYGDKDTPPAHYINLTMTTGDGIQIPDNAAKVRFEGIGIIGNTTGAAVHMNGARNSGLLNCYVKNTNTTAGSYAMLLDTSTGGADGEDNDSAYDYFWGGYAGLGIGVGDVTFHANDNTWYSITTHGGTYGVNMVAGGNNTFIEWYDRSNPSGASFFVQGGEPTIIGGEDRNTAALMVHVSAGECWMIRRAITQSTGTGITVDGGELYLDSCRSNTFTVNVTSGFCIALRNCYFGTATMHLTGGTVYHPTVWLHPWTRTGTGGTYTAY